MNTIDKKRWNINFNLNNNTLNEFKFLLIIYINEICLAKNRTLCISQIIYLEWF